MLRHDERIEHLISRKLDGELTDDERLELDRALIRSPEHRRMLEESENIDALCADLIRDSVHADPAVPLVSPSSQRIHPLPTGPGRRHLWWILPGALAACFAWFAFTPTADGPGLLFEPGVPIVKRDPISAETIPSPLSVGATPIRQVGTHPSMTDGRRDTGLYRVIGNDGRLYLIQVDHLRTLRRPAKRTGERVALDEL